MPATLAAASDIYNAALAFTMADHEFCDADDALSNGTTQRQGNGDMWQRYEAAQDKLNDARRELMKLCDTRIRGYGLR
jgi:hypothetical protein